MTINRRHVILVGAGIALVGGIAAWPFVKQLLPGERPTPVPLAPEPRVIPMPQPRPRRSTRDEVIRRTLVHEGGSRYTNHPSDPGGPTKYGITIHDVRRYLNSRATAAHVQRLTEAQAITIYVRHYWNAVRADELPQGIDYSVFDFGVNSGVGRARQYVRLVLGLRQHMGPLTDAEIALVKRADPKVFINKYNDARLAFVRRIRTFPVFGRGWTRRIASVRAGSLHMAGVATADLGGDIMLIPRYGPGRAYADQPNEVY